MDLSETNLMRTMTVMMVELLEEIEKETRIEHIGQG